MLAPMTDGRGRESARVVPDRARRRDEIVDADARQPHGRLPVHEVHGRGDGRRHGGRARRRDARAGRRARRPGRPARLPPRLVRTRPIPVLVAEHPDLCALARDGSAASAGALADGGRRHRRRRVPRPLLVLRELAALRVRRARASRRPIRAASPSPAGSPYHGGPASGYLTHSIAAMVERLRADARRVRPRVSGVGMHMTKHVFGVYSTDAGRA